MLSFTLKSLFLTFVIFFIGNYLNTNKTFAQSINKEKFQYISPVPSSKLNSSETNIIIRYGDQLNKSSLNNKSTLQVTGSKSGKHSGKLILAENGRTLIFLPVKQFSDGEVVTVKLAGNLETITGKKVPLLKYSFKTSRKNLNKEIRTNPEKYSKLINPDFDITGFRSVPKINSLNIITAQKTYSIQKDSLPDDFPKSTVDSINNPSPGYIFFTPFDRKNPNPSYLIITDNYGIPVFYRKMPNRTYDFTKQSTGILTYYILGSNQHYLLDSSYNIIDSLQMQNGYTTNVHDLVILKNRHSLLMCYDEQHVAMDSIVAGGNPNAIVQGLVIQELDKDKNVVFQWRSWDHFKITDATSDISLTDSIIDYVHCNSIDMDNDGNIIISCRHMDEVTKINRETGDIIWRMGGEQCKNNQFTFINDPIGFSHQHDVRRLPDGDLTLFDNGNLHNPKFSRAVEYQLDEENKTATLVWEYRNNPSTYSQAMGSVRRLENQNTFIGWGWTNVSPAMSEVKSDGSIALYFSWSSNLLNYRALKYSWETSLFSTNTDSLDFGYIQLSDSLIKSLTIINNSNQEIEINGLLNRDSAYIVNADLPVIIPALDSAEIKVKFKPEAGADHSDDLYLQWNSKDERIARVVHLSGYTNRVATSVKANIKEFAYSLKQNYPNPFNPSTKIRFTIPEKGNVILKVYDILGREIKTLVNRNLNKGSFNITFNANDLSSGVYIYTLRVNNYIKSRKMIFLR